MKIDLYSNMKNEEAMLPYWLRHYETIADRIFVWDGGSTDETLEILGKHPKVILLPRGEQGHNDHYYVAKLYPQYKEHSRGEAAWVMIVDADEFIYHPELRKVLKKLLEEEVEIVQCEGYSMIADKFPTTNRQIYEEINKGIPSQFDTKWTIHSPDVEVHYRKGRHGRPYGFSKKYVSSRASVNGIKLLHYRYIGDEYIKAREEKNIKDMKLAYPEQDWSYTVEGPRTMPDGEKINIFEWVKKNMEKAVNVLEI